MYIALYNDCNILLKSEVIQNEDNITRELKNFLDDVILYEGDSIKIEGE